MAITDEMREYVDKCVPGLVGAELKAIADRIETEHSDEVLAAVQIARRGISDSHMELPPDCEGIPCKMDELVWLGKQRLQVIAITHKGKLALRPEGGKGVTWVPSRHVTHRKPLTVEGLLRTFWHASADCNYDNDKLADVIAEFAPKLRLAGDAR